MDRQYQSRNEVSQPRDLGSQHVLSGSAVFLILIQIENQQENRYPFDFPNKELQ